MTPVEERIDHEQAKRIADFVSERAARLDGYSPDMWIYTLARAYLDLLTEHSAREEENAALRAACCIDFSTPSPEVFRRAHEMAREKGWAAPGVTASSIGLTGEASGEGNDPDTGAALPATESAQPEDCPKCRHAQHEPGICGADVGTGYHGPIPCQCGVDTRIAQLKERCG